MATRSEQLDWQEIHLSEDEASAQGTHAVRFLVQQVEKAQKNPYLKPILNNLMMAHALRLGIYEPNMEFPTAREVSSEGVGRDAPLPRSGRESHSQDDVFSRRSSSPSPQLRRPLERQSNLPRRIHSHREHENEGKRRQSSSREVSSSPSVRGRKREKDRRSKKSSQTRRTPSPSDSPSYGSSSSSPMPSSDGTSSPIRRKRRRHDSYRAWKRSRKLQKFRNEKGPYKGPGKLSTEDMQRYRKENRCYKCGEQGHISRACPKRQPPKVTPQATKILYPNQAAQEACQLCFAWGNVRDISALILFDPGSTHNFISKSLLKGWGFKPKRWE